MCTYAREPMLRALNPWEWSEHTLAVLTALGTAGAVLVALAVAAGRGLIGSAHERRHAPKLLLTHIPDEDLMRESQEAFQGMVAAMVIPEAYVRLGVSNEKRRRAAHDVEVLVILVETLKQDESIDSRVRDEPHRNAGPLAWTHAEPPALAIGPGIRRTVDLASLQRPRPRSRG